MDIYQEVLGLEDQLWLHLAYLSLHDLTLLVSLLTCIVQGLAELILKSLGFTDQILDARIVAVDDLCILALLVDLAVQLYDVFLRLEVLVDLLHVLDLQHEGFNIARRVLDRVSLLREPFLDLTDPIFNQFGEYCLQIAPLLFWLCFELFRDGVRLHLDHANALTHVEASDVLKLIFLLLKSMEEGINYIDSIFESLILKQLEISVLVLPVGLQTIIEGLQVFVDLLEGILDDVVDNRVVLLVEVTLFEPFVTVEVF